MIQIGIWGWWESACRWGVLAFYRRFGDNADFLIGALSGISAKRVSRLTDSFVCVVATWPVDWLTHRLGLSLKLYV